MGYNTPTPFVMEPREYLALPLRERLRIATVEWGQNGFGSPRKMAVLHIAKVLLLWGLVGSIVITATSGLGWFWQVDRWWNEPIFYEKLIVWTMLLETIGIAGSWGPLAGKFAPMTGGIRFWARPGTIRLRPWAWVPGTAGDRRTAYDVVVYLLLIASLAAALVLPGVVTPSLAAVLPENTTGVVQPAPVIAALVFLVLIGVRDKTVALAARIEQYAPALVLFAFFPFVDVIIGLKLLIIAAWGFAALSKLNHHFPRVLPPMLSNTPFWPPQWLKRAMYRSYPTDMRPSGLAFVMAHGLGAGVELVLPLIMLFSTNMWLTLACVVVMVGYCLFIISTFPVAVPLEWNALFAFGAVALFLGFPAWDGFAVWDASSWWSLAIIVVGLSFFPILGNIRPDKVSFLPSMRQYAGNWATSLWTFTPGAEDRLDEVQRPTRNQNRQLETLGFDEASAEMMLQKSLGWRALHSQARGLFSLMLRNLEDVDQRTVREGEFACNAMIGFNFGDGHLHGVDLVRAIQRQVGYAPGEMIVFWVESEPVFRGTQEYKIIDAALGVIEEGTWKVVDAVDEQPWLPRGPIPIDVTWRADIQPPQTKPQVRGEIPAISAAVPVAPRETARAAARAARRP